MNWCDYLKSGILDRGFHQSTADACLLVRGRLLTVVCVDDIIIVGKREKEIEQLFRPLKDVFPMDADACRSQSTQSAVKLNKFDFTDDGDMKTFLGVEIQRTLDGTHLLQSHLIERMLQIMMISIIFVVYSHFLLYICGFHVL